jgi:hypothetical protein
MVPVLLWSRLMTGAVGRRSVRAEFYCGALTRKKRRCRVYKLRGRKRCKFHAGLSTGPRTDEGKARVAEAQRKAWASLRASLGLPPWWRSTANQVSKGKRESAADYIAKHGRYVPPEGSS